jgi:hypothetical protein
VVVSREFLPLEAKEIKNYLLSVVSDHYDLEEELKQSSSIEYEIEP